MIIIITLLENLYYIFSISGVIIALLAALYVKRTYENSIKQNIGNDFFNLLSVHNELKRNLKLNIKNTITNISSLDEKRKNGVFEFEEKTDYIGLEVFELIKLDFEILFKEFDSILPYATTENDIKLVSNIKTFGLKIKKDWIKEELLKEIIKVNNSKNKEQEKIQIVFDKIAHEYKEVIYHYCRNWYNIVKFLRDKEIKLKIDLKNYSDILQSQISNNEMIVLFYNVLWFPTNSQHEDYYPINLAKHFDLFQNIGLSEEIFEKHKNLIKNGDS
ncbi:putative phage abortive infection protein [Chryseobacterium nepalense]|uniref:putative phage abortive infection protein n=1 Tax=Chryseobacterium nepalense TaxID=1854498 RepID=UPI002DF7D184|nr:hypothetical protein [Chryseobacterium nepalense]